MKLTFMGMLLCLACLLGACSSSSSSSHTVSADEFNRSCTVDADCVAVYEGPIGCCGPGCSNAAVNTASYNAYQTAVTARQPTCAVAYPCGLWTNEICRAGATCAGGTCAFRDLSTDASSSD
jgi:hypothetical protein